MEGDRAILGGIARLAKPDAAITLLLSVTARDHLPDLEHLDLAVYGAHGLELQIKRLATRRPRRGVVFEGPPEDRDWGRRAVTTDPTGHTVHIMSP